MIGSKNDRREAALRRWVRAKTNASAARGWITPMLRQVQPRERLGSSALAGRRIFPQLAFETARQLLGFLSGSAPHGVAARRRGTRARAYAHPVERQPIQARQTPGRTNPSAHKAATL